MNGVNGITSGIQQFNNVANDIIKQQGELSQKMVDMAMAQIKVNASMKVAQTQTDMYKEVTGIGQNVDYTA